MSTIRTDTLTNVAGSKSVPVDTVVDGSAKAWVNFNGTGTVAIRAAFNVRSITDNGVGDYTINFTVAMPDANYVMCGGGVLTPNANFDTIIVGARRLGGTGSYLAGSLRIQTVGSGAGITAIDPDSVNVSIFR